ncbi:hypothetical protein [Pseudonocardia sp. KRD291]|uniref:hypothetical protein n=1 Tax=Pseudonocardia sp. KRD291 TaxID=2792007 RepID=UPI001C4A526B|nr:hypothetical protein [Pseudonocardia sp. KRD291]MBW0107090.1 hypothetical protein [Pseudonocardia sp. KRD291]
MITVPGTTEHTGGQAGALPVVAGRDVGDAATGLLRRRDLSGPAVREVLGGADRTVGESARPPAGSLR